MEPILPGGFTAWSSRLRDLFLVPIVSMLGLSLDGTTGQVSPTTASIFNMVALAVDSRRRCLSRDC
jgi:hypothetical protein